MIFKLPTAAIAAALCGAAFVKAGAAQVAPVLDETGALPAPYLSTSSAPETSFVMPRTPEGRPDFQGVVWETNFFAPLSAMPEIVSQELVLSEEEAKTAFTRLAGVFSSFPGFELDPEIFVLLAESGGLPLVRGERRSRLLVLPDNGALPYTPEALKDATKAMANMMRQAADDPEGRPTGERCLSLGGQPPAVLVSSLNPRQFIQTKDHVVILHEYGDEVRIIPFAPGVNASAPRSWMGNAAARWEGDTLVIESAGFREEDRIRGSFPLALIVNPDAKVIERYTRVSEDELVYQFTVEDSKAFTAPWLAEYSLYRAGYRMYPSSCHEGNYALANILRGQRVAEERILKDAETGRPSSGPSSPPSSSVRSPR